MAISAKYLLDTNVLIWSSMRQNMLSEKARDVLLDTHAILYISIVSAWEMQIKHSQGKLPIPDPAPQLALRYMAELAADFLPLRMEHISALYELPYLHKDPFDRMLLAQCLSEGLTFVTPDRALQAYNVPIIW